MTNGQHETKAGDTIRGCINALMGEFPGDPEQVQVPAALSAGEHYVVAVNEREVAVQNSPDPADLFWLKSWVRVKEK